MEPKSLIVFLDEIEDTRKTKGKRHQQLSILVIMRHYIDFNQSELPLASKGEN